MELKEQNILFLTRTMSLGGTENVILQLCEILKTEVNKIVVCSSGGVNEKKLKDEGIRHIKIEDIENKNPLKIIKNIKIINKTIKEENITIIHSHHRMAAMYANLINNKKIIKLANVHNTFKNKKFLTKLAYRNTKIIAVGEQVKKNLTDFFNINKEQITVIHNAIKPFDGRITIDKEIEKYKNDGYITIANIGRLSEQKGMKYFIEAAEIISKENKMVRFLIIGCGEDEEKLKALVKEKKLEDRIIFMGYRSDIQNLMSQIDYIVLSSLWEGLPLTPIEAFSVGKTIIATSVDGTVEIVKNEENGFLVQPRDSKQLAEKIKELIENKEKKRQFEMNAKKTYEEEFSFKRLHQQYIEYYNKISKEG